MSCSRRMPRPRSSMRFSASSTTRSEEIGCQSSAEKSTSHSISPRSCSTFSRVGSSAFFRTVAGLDLLLRGVLRRDVIDERINEGFVGRVPVGDDLPALAIPLLYAPVARALVVGAGNPDRLQHPLEAELLEACIGEVEVLEPPTNLLARQRLLAELFLRLADRLHADLARLC